MLTLLGAFDREKMNVHGKSALERSIIIATSAVHVALHRLAITAGNDLTGFDVQPTHLDTIEKSLRATAAQHGMDTHPILGEDIRLGRDGVLEAIREMLTD